MKKLACFAIISLFSLSAIFAQAEGYRGQRKTVDNVECKISKVDYSEISGALDIFFTAAVDPRSVNGATIYIDNGPVGNGVKVTFNRDGTQARVIINRALPFMLKLSGIKSYDGDQIQSYTKKLQ